LQLGARCVLLLEVALLLGAVLATTKLE